MAKGERLDRYLVRKGLVESRAKAQALIAAGQVLVDGVRVRKPAFAVGEGASVRVLSFPEFVGRGAEKLLGALSAFGIDVEGRVVADVGASTGGFTQVLLERGARRVYAIDVGHGQLHPRLREDPRVVVMEGVNARYLEALPEPVSMAVMDVSFISSTLVLPRLAEWTSAGGDVLVLVKPQFELEPGSHRGVVRDPEARRRARERVAACGRELGLLLVGEAPSPIAGKRGNLESWLWFKKPEHTEIPE